MVLATAVLLAAAWPARANTAQSLWGPFPLDTRINHAPMFTSTPATTAAVGASYRYEITANDPDAEDIPGSLTVTAPTKPAWLTLTGGAGEAVTLSGTPLGADAGDNAVVVRVTDGQGAFSEQSFTVQVSWAVAIQVTPATGLYTTETGGTARFSVILTHAPTADVEIDLSSSDPAEGLVAPTTLRFTTTDWGTPHEVEVTGADDGDADGPIAYTVITAPARSTDLRYDGLNPMDAAVVNLDNDKAGVLFTVRMENADRPEVTFGMLPEATDGFDPGVDVLAGAPVEGLGHVALVIPVDPTRPGYAHEIRGLADASTWWLAVDADAEMTLSWEGGLVPVNTILLWREFAPATGLADPATTIDLATAGTHTVPAGTSKLICISYGPASSFPLPLRAGWNLISLPIEPADPRVTAMFADTARREGDAALRDGLHGMVTTGPVWGWNTWMLDPVAYVEALTGYWLYVRNPVTVTVRGLAPNQASMPLHAGWNLVGPPREMPNPDLATVTTPIWWWNGSCYQTASRVYPGRGYWIFCNTPATWVFGE